MRDDAKVKVLVLDDSLLFREFMAKGLEGDGRIELVGFARDPFDAKDKILRLAPDVMTLEIEMPRMDGIKFLRRLMPQYPLASIVVSSLKASVFEAMDAGAADFMAKPDSLTDDPKDFFVDLKSRIIAASRTRFAYRRRTNTGITLEAEGLRGEIDPQSIIAIGASTGGTDAINSILTKFSPNMPGMVVVQHMPAGFTAMYAKRLDEDTNLDVKEAEDGDEVRPGRVLIAPGDYHLRVERVGTGKERSSIAPAYRVRCGQGQKVGGHRPSVDVLFDSVAEAAGSHALGVILTGMGTDGAAGLKKIRDYGGYTIGQDERSSVVYGMPMAAYLSGAVMVQFPLYRIPDEIVRKLSER
ncbi:MAG: chemotaxis response regulator protein-glutamate methylesterase [Clostridiales bacterium]|nr:chemotaxis response regulator protein-glutamate methylesterase [Clostridiales bacterium]